MRKVNEWFNKTITRKDCLVYGLFSLVISLIYIAVSFGYVNDFGEKIKGVKEKLFHKSYSSKEL